MLSKPVLIFPSKVWESNTLVITFCLTLSLLLTTNIFGKDRNKKNVVNKVENAFNTNKIPLPDNIGDWRAIGISRTLSTDQVSNMPDGDVYKEYGLRTLTIRSYTNGKTKLTVELFQTHFTSEAYGLSTFIRDYSPQKRQLFHTSHFLLSIYSDAEDKSSDHSFTDLLKEGIVSEEGELPSLPFSLPKERRLNNTDKYIIGPVALGRITEFAELKDVVSFAGGTHAVIASYQNGNGQMSLAIFEFHTPQLATDGYAQIQKYLDKLLPSERNSRLLRRIGNYIVVATNVQDISSVEDIVSQIKYSPKVYWEGKKITDVPIHFRPLDPILLEEASQTANMVIRTFYWIGVMIFGAIMIGFMAGSFLFYWNRYRRRKLGVDDIFSDAGGTIRLNLDE